MIFDFDTLIFENFNFFFEGEYKEKASNLKKLFKSFFGVYNEKVRILKKFFNFSQNFN